MHKVVVERPRSNPGSRKRGRRANLDVDLLPRCEGMRRAHFNRKCFTDLLGPLRRWLHSQLGRPWNDVYSEACRVIKPDSVIRAHIKTHLLEFVMRDTFIRDGEVWCFTRWCFTRWGWINEVRVNELSDRWHPFYVHPATGLLNRVPHVPKWPSDWYKLNLALQSVRRWIADDRLLVKWRGIWFECDMRPMPGYGECHFDLLWRTELYESHASEAYGKQVYCAGKRQLSRKALQSYTISNGSSGEPSCLAAVLGYRFCERARASTPYRSRLRHSGMLCRSRQRCEFSRAVDRGFSWTRQWRCNSAPRNIPRWCNYSTPGNSTVVLLPAFTSDGPKTSGYRSLVRLQSSRPHRGVAQW